MKKWYPYGVLSIESVSGFTVKHAPFLRFVHYRNIEILTYKGANSYTFNLTKI